MYFFAQILYLKAVPMCVTCDFATLTLFLLVPILSQYDWWGHFFWRL